MLFKTKTLSQIKNGQVSIAFRKWKRPTIKVGGSLITRIGVLDILKIEPTSLEKITKSEYQMAGIEDISSFQNLINKKEEGELYKIEFRLSGPDPRINLRNDPNL